MIFWYLYLFRIQNFDIRIYLLSFYYQLFHGLIKSVYGERVHRKKLSDRPYGGVDPDPFVVRVKPDAVAEVV